MKEVNQELKRVLSLRFPSLGTSEFLRACKAAAAKTEPAIADEIESWRKQFTPSYGSAAGVLLSADRWTQVYADSEQAAREELLKDSSELSELDRLNKVADEARKLADEKDRQLQAAWSELNSIPDQIDSLNAQLQRIATEAQSLDGGALASELRGYYKAMLNGNVGAGSFMDAIALKIATADLRREVLESMDAELSAEVSKLQARAKVLSKKFGGVK